MGQRALLLLLAGLRAEPACRAGLNARTAAQSDAQQVSLEMGQGGYDLDQEIEGLAGSVARLKQARRA